MTTKEIYIISLIIITTLAIAYILNLKPAQPAPLPKANGYCLADIFPSYGDLNITSPNAGEHSYQIIATTRGVEVWRECDKK